MFGYEGSFLMSLASVILNRFDHQMERPNGFEISLNDAYTVLGGRLSLDDTEGSFGSRLG